MEKKLELESKKNPSHCLIVHIDSDTTKEGAAKRY